MTINNNVRSSELYLNDPGPYLARVVSHGDATYMGMIQVELLNDVGNPIPELTGHVIYVSYLSPFYGVTSLRYSTDSDSYDSTQKSYGMWMVPPDVGMRVMVIFVNGHAAKGYWIGCVPDAHMNFMVPGLAASETHTDTANGSERKVVAEYNKKTKKDLTQTDTTQFAKPVHPLQKIFDDQGLGKDDTRGITSSSARREAPSAVFGISTPGPIDSRPGAPTGDVGKRESRNNTFVSRLGGTTFVMDDGDKAFIRKTPAADGPPEYVSVENRETGGQPDIPHNELVRIRTRTGHQILLHNSEDLIYIGNAKGTTWIELTSNGKIDIYAKDSVSIHTEQDLNIKADQDINLDAGRNVNIRSGAAHNVEVATTHSLIVNGDQKISVAKNKNETIGANRNTSITGLSSEGIGQSFNLQTGSNVKITSGAEFALLSTGANKFTSSATTSIYSGANINLTSGGKINLNGPVAEAATSATITDAVQPEALAVVAARIPMHEPWDGHENLHGQDPTQYTTSTDTFKKVSK